MNKTEFIKAKIEDDTLHYKSEKVFEEVSKVIERNNIDGYKVVSVTPLISGYNNHSDDENQSYGYGFSYTSGVIIVFEKINEI
ncbi:hypothetical protein ATO12_17110 [Aquimarina atlantica]|uniref:DUF4177 domain-containing protein n=1 Tax=Aquimarina atlantica TaxID=1317122 RepID=A0A023BUL0_9FLAO|nr:hypothetical protein [Aquimarina atlantica]EZH73655.1 hypothetical protein ATO12_17110 [Aquimarina atlantica]